MQTIASLAERLDMSAEDAMATLRRLRFEVESIETEISDDQCDILMDVDEDPSTLDKLLRDLEKKEEQARKRAEKLKKAAEKKRADVEKKAAKAIADAERARAAELEAAAAAGAALEEAFPEPEPAVSAVVDEPAVEPVTIAEIMPEAAPVEEVPAVEELPAVPAAEPVVHVVAEIVPPGPIVQQVAEILPERAEDHDSEPAPQRERGVQEHKGALARAEEEEDQQRKRRKAKEALTRPLPQPDPAVVAEVIRKAKEREREKARRREQPVESPVGTGRVDIGRFPTVEEEEERPKDPGRGKKATGKTARKKQRRAERARELEDSMRRDAAAAVRGMHALGGATKKKKKRRTKATDEVGTEEIRGGILEVQEGMTVERLADAMEMEVNDIILELMDENVLATKNQALDFDIIRRIAEKYDYEVRTVIPEEEELFADEPDKPEDLVPRAPVVTVMGHVDHGKTSLLDVVREANVAEGEAGGITQHIAAYEVELPQGRVVFLDTPGHEAFTQMRARGAKATDVVVLVVAADDGVKPQTIEAIDHARAAEVPIVVAINKIDKPNAQPDRVRQELTQYGLVGEEWGGNTLIKNISAKTREGIGELMELLVLQAQMLELKANPNKRARGVVIEAEISRGQGPVAWVLVQSGTLRTGDVFLCGNTYGRVRTLVNARGEHLQEAGPATPVVVTGFSAPADAGDQFVCVADERVARGVAEQRALLERLKKGPAPKRMTLEDFHARMSGREQKTLRVLVKADVQGSVDVLSSSLAKIGNDEAGVEVVHAGVGNVNESDIMLASASDAVVIGFHTTANSKAQQLAEQEGVEIRLYKIIYETLDDVRKALEGMLTPDTQEVIMGHAEIRAVFHSSTLGNIAGCYQLDGETVRGGKARVLRNGERIFEGTIDTLRRAKDDVRSVNAGFECGIRLSNFDAIQEGDIIETYRLEIVPRTLR